MARSRGTRYPRGGSDAWQGAQAGPTLLRAEFFGAEQGAISGALTATLADASLTAAGEAAGGAAGITGSLAATLAPATATGAARTHIAGTLTGTLAQALASVAGGTRVTGALAGTLGAATLTASGTAQASVPVTGSVTATLGDAVLDSTGVVVGADPIWPQPAGRGSNLRDVWTFKPFEVRRKGRKPKRYKTAQAATTAAREAAKSGDSVTVTYLGDPVVLPSLRTASYAEIIARLALVERQQDARFEREQIEALREAELRRQAQERDDEEVLVLALAHLWRL